MDSKHERKTQRRRAIPVIATLIATTLAASPAMRSIAAGSGATSTSTSKANPATAQRAASSTQGSAAATPSAGGDYAARFASLCASCHGPGGASAIEGTPSLAGQHGFYVVTQLFLFREGRRDNPAMTAVAKTLTDADLRGFSSLVDTLPPLPPAVPPSPADPARMQRGEALAQQHKCVFCHGGDLAGGQQVPRIGGQREEYLREALRGFKSGARPGYTMAMTEAVSQVSVDDLDTLAYFAAHFGVGGK